MRKLALGLIIILSGCADHTGPYDFDADIRRANHPEQRAGNPALAAAVLMNIQQQNLQQQRMMNDNAAELMRVINRPVAIQPSSIRLETTCNHAGQFTYCN